MIGAAAATTVVATASPSSVSQLGGTADDHAPRVLDANNNGLAGVPVSFSTDQGTLSPVTATTNANGHRDDAR